MFERPSYLKWLIQFKDSDFVKVITGVCRSGKSTLLMLYKDYLLQEGILEELLQKDTKKVYLLLDEIRMVEGWQRVVNSIRVSFNSDIIITGLNTNMYAFGGDRYTFKWSIHRNSWLSYSFSFFEFLNAKEIEVVSRKVDDAYDKYGRFPSVVIDEESIKDTM
ncbi:AAA family ATPase [Listeria farberi]|uniref:AAA family ATPase n=1 Tax=Listeria farberi TaxID=2713500 RepID=UPI0021AE28D2|nr:AAA family ATPase [Listeria farberi]